MASSFCHCVLMIFPFTVLAFQKLEEEDKSVACAGNDDSDLSDDDRITVAHRCTHSSGADSGTAQISPMHAHGSVANAALEQGSTDSPMLKLTKPSPEQAHKEPTGSNAPLSLCAPKPVVRQQSGSEFVQESDRSVSPAARRRGTWAGKTTNLSAQTARRRGQMKRRSQKSPSPRPVRSTRVANRDRGESWRAVNVVENDEPDGKAAGGSSPGREKVIPFATVLPVQEVEATDGLVRSRSVRLVRRRSSTENEGPSDDKPWQRRSMAVRPRARQQSGNSDEEMPEQRGKPQNMPVVVHPLQVREWWHALVIHVVVVLLLLLKSAQVECIL